MMIVRLFGHPLVQDSLSLHEPHHYLFHYRTWLVYSNDGLPQNDLGLREQASWMHTEGVLD